MQSQGSTSSQPSSDSLSSSDSFIFSDSELAEDDADVFLTDSSPSVIIGGGGGVNADSGTAPASPGSQWASDGFTDREEEGELDRSETGSRRRRGTDDLDTASCTHKSQGDLLFAQKCAELQGFIRPLLELLHGLKKGRFDRGLSSFQQSVAMDRIQRIVGVLQRPKGGEKYLNTLLQVEMMLKMWFPKISTSPPSTTTSACPAVSTQSVAGCTPPHKHRDQLHIPVKKRRLSWTGTDSPTPSPVLAKRRHMNEEEKTGRPGDDDGRSPPPLLDTDMLHSHQDLPRASQSDRESQGRNGDSEESRESSSYQAGHCSEPNLTWVHVAPILSPPKACTPHKGTAASESGKQLIAANPSPTSRGSPATQDNSISSTTPNKHPKNQKKPIRCQSQPVAGEKTETLETCQGQSQSAPVIAKTLARVCPAPLET